MIVMNKNEPSPVSKDSAVVKGIIHTGNGGLCEYENETKLTYHYQIKRPSKDNEVIDDSKTDGSSTPLELIIGKKFKLEFWETCLKTMCVNEVASFRVPMTFLLDFPIVMKQLRNIRKGKSQQSHHCCGMSMQDQGLGYSDLDELLKTPEELDFTFELLNVERHGDYQKEGWCMTESEKIDNLSKLREEGNLLYISGDFMKASQKYALALGLIEQLLLKEKPHSETWETLDLKKIPLLLNYAQCKLLNNEYYEAIEHTTEVLKKDPKNVKALFRRAKAHVGAWNPDIAKTDFITVKELDKSLEKSVNEQLFALDILVKEQDNADSSRLKGRLF